MSTEKYNVLSVRLNGKNYLAWAIQFRIFVLNKELWGHVDSTSSAPDKEKQEDDYAKWKVKDAQVMAWIIGSVDPNIFLNLTPFNTAAKMWAYLKKLYIQNNLARWFQLEHEIDMFQQDSLSISEFSFSFMTLWNKYANIVYEGLSAADIIAVQKVHQTTKRDLFLMKLRSDFEGIRSNLMNRATVPTLEACLDELLCEEQRLLTHIWEQQKSASIWVRNPSSDLSSLGQRYSYSNFSNSIHGICKYDVFISFRGTDTRDNFTDHLYHHLIRKGIFTFKDDKMLEKGQPISPQLLQAIKESRVSIVIFSKDYAASTWCLDEMATIVDCHKDLKRTVFPVFYDVDPSDVRKQNGVYEKAFVSHTQRFEEDPGKVDRWKRAMMGLANSVGWDVRKKPEFMEIEKIVQEVVKTLGHKFSGLADDLIGIQRRVDELEKLLKLSSEDDGCRVLGICGMGGIGKTTLATVLYDRISYQFHACCFIEDTSKICKHGDPIAAQKQILRETLCETNLDTYSPSEISGILRNRLCNIKVLVVLDNVDSLSQLERLAINPKLLCAGSRIVITTRNEHILKVYGADAIYTVPLLNKNVSHELFCRKAFKSGDPITQFMELTLIPRVLKYTQGLPLAIRVMGSFLCTRNATQWIDALDRVGDYPDNQIVDVLQISFEGLQPQEKEIFLHIACFFNGEREDYVKRILDGCGLHPDIGIQVLLEKSLVTIRNQEIHMHGMLQDLGRRIVQIESPENCESWSRLWRYNDFHHVLMSKMGTNNTKAIVLDQNVDASGNELLSSEELSKMRGLKLLIIYQRNFAGILNFLSNNLQCLLWYGYPFISLPSNFQPKKLVELNMSDSSIKRLWEGIKNLPCLKRLDLSNSKHLVEMPNFEGIPNLERLDLTGCTNLSQVHPSIGLLKELVFLSLRNCSSLVSLYLDGASNFSLRVLHLSGCTQLENTPDFTGISNLEYLDLERCTSLYTIHESIGSLVKLKFLSLRCCSNLVTVPNSVNTMTSLTTLDLHSCSKLTNFPLGQRSELEEPTYVAICGYVPSSCMGSLVSLDLGYCNLCEIPDAIGELSSLERLNLQGNKFASLPDNIHRLSCLAYLNLSHCHMLQFLPLLPSSNASSVGKYFGTVSGARNHRSGVYIYDCPKLVESEHSQLLGSEWALAWLTRLVEEPRHFRCGFDIVIHGSAIPEWFDHQFIGGSVIRTVHSDVDDNWIGFAFCVAFEVNYHQAILDSSHNSSASMLAQSSSLSSSLPHPLYLSFESQNTEESFKLPLGFDLEKNVHSKYLWLIYISQPHCHFVKSGAHITFKACPDLEIRKWGLRMIFKQDIVPMNRGFDCEKEPPSKLQKTDKGIEVDCCHFDHVHETQRWSSCSEKIQLPYNWLVTETEEIENMEAKEKENNIAFIGL